MLFQNSGTKPLLMLCWPIVLSVNLILQDNGQKTGIEAGPVLAGHFSI